MLCDQAASPAGHERYSVEVHISGAEDFARSSTTAAFDTEAAALRAAAEYVVAHLYPIHHITWQYTEAMSHARPSWGCISYEATAQAALQDRAVFGAFFETAETPGSKGLPDERRAALLLRGCAYLHGIRDPETARSYFARLAQRSAKRSHFFAGAPYELAPVEYATRNWAGSLRHLRDADEILGDRNRPER